MISFNTAAIAAVIPSISYQLYLPTSNVARIIPFYMIPYGLGALIYAPLVKIFRPKPIKIFSLSFFTIFCLFCGSAYSLNIILFSRIFMGLAAAAVIPLALIIIGQAYPKEVRGRMVGVFFSVTFVASLFGVFFSGIMDWRWLFFIPAILGLVTTGLVLFLFPDNMERITGFETNYLTTLLKKDILKIFVFIFLVSMLYHSVYNWLGVYLERGYNLNQLHISLLLTLIGLSGAFGQVLGGFITDKKGRMKSCHLGLIILAISVMLLSVRFPVWWLVLIFISFGIGWTINHNSLATILTDFPDKYRPEVSSLNSAVRFISGGIGVALSGLFIEKNFGFTYLAFGIILLVLSVFIQYFVNEATTLDI